MKKSLSLLIWINFLCCSVNKSGYLGAHLDEALSFNEEATIPPLDVQVSVNGRYAGIAYIVIKQDVFHKIFIERNSIEAIVKNAIAETSHEIILQKIPNNNSYFEPFTHKIISIFYDDSCQNIKITIAPEHLKTFPISIYKNHSVTEIDKITHPSPWSGYANMYYGKKISHASATHHSKDFHPGLFSTDCVIQHNDWALENVLFAGDAEKNLIRRGSTLWTKDYQEDNLRLGIGDVSYSIIGLQRSVPLLGISFNKNTNIFLARSCSPIDKYDFFLPSQSSVDIFVNDVLFQSYNLNAGPHSLRDFPVNYGTNRIKLRITDTSGRQEFVDLNYFYDPCLLFPGELQYSSTIGAPREWDGSGYLWNRVLYSGFFRYGLYPTWTSGAYVQFNNKISQFGFENVFLMNGVTTTVDLGTAWMYSQTIQPRFRITCDNSSYTSIDGDSLYWNGSWEYLGKKYTDSMHYNRSCYAFSNTYNSLFSVFSLGLSRKLCWNIFGSLGLQRRWLRTGKTCSGINVSLSTNVSSSLSFMVSGYAAQQTHSKSNKGFLLTLTWTPSDSDFYTRTSYSSDHHSFYQSINYSHQFADQSSLQANIGADVHDSHKTGNGSINYIGERFESSLTHTHTRSIDHYSGKKTWQATSSATFGTCIAFTGGVFGISRPINDSFIMIAPKKCISQYKLEINPLGEDDCMAKTWGPLPAILPNVNPYQVTSVTISSKHLPIGYELSPSIFYCLPKYKSGTLIEVGNERTFFAEGKITNQNGSPLACAFGVFQNIADPNIKISFFTNRIGRYQIEGLKAGKYQVFLSKFELPVAVIEVKDELESGFIEIEDIQIK